MDMLQDVEFEIAKLELGPTDILAVRVTKPVTSVLVAELRSRLERRLGLSGRVLVLEPGTELTVVTAADPATKTAAERDQKLDSGVGRRGGK
jgi:hypothetical protein